MAKRNAWASAALLVLLLLLWVSSPSSQPPTPVIKLDTSEAASARGDVNVAKRHRAKVEKQGYEPASCPDDVHWLSFWIRDKTSRPDVSRGLTLVDVGANKGFTVASWASLLSLNPNRALVAEVMGRVAGFAAERGIVAFCGACCDCEELLDHRSTAMPAGRLRRDQGGPGHNIIAFEPLPANADFLADLLRSDFRESDAFDAPKESLAEVSSRSRVARKPVHTVLLGDVSVTLEHQAVGGKQKDEGARNKNPHPGFVPFANAALGSEIGRIWTGGTKPTNAPGHLGKGLLGQLVTGKSGTLPPKGNSTAPVILVATTTLDEYFSVKKMESSTTTPPTSSSGEKWKFPSDLFIDLLLTDTEGHDAQVYSGAQQLLGQGLIGIYVMELWASPRDNQEMLHEMSSTHNFKCYLPLQKTAQLGGPAVGGGRISKPEKTGGSEVPVHVDRYMLWEDYWHLLTVKKVVPFPLQGWYNAMCVHREHNPRLIRYIDSIRQEDTKNMVLQVARYSHADRCPVSGSIYRNPEFHAESVKRNLTIGSQDYKKLQGSAIREWMKSHQEH